MASWIAPFLASLFGFALAGFVAAAFRAAGHDRLAFQARFATPVEASWSLALCIFAGPYIVASAAARRWRLGALTALQLSAAVALTGVWSFCSGVVVFQVLGTAGLGAMP